MTLTPNPESLRPYTLRLNYESPEPETLNLRPVPYTRNPLYPAPVVRAPCARGVTVVVVAVPEGLPLAVTLALAFSVRCHLTPYTLETRA